MVDGMSGLFREELLEARRTRLEGEVLLSRPLRAHAIITLLTGTMIALAVWVGTGRYSRTEGAKGILVTNADSAKIVALRPGVVTKLSVSDGQAVHKGQILATVQVDQDYAEGGRATQEGLGAVETQRQLTDRQITASRDRARDERAGLASTIASSRQQAEEVQGQIAIQEQMVQTLKAAFDRYGPVAQKGFITQVDMEKRQQELLVARQELGRLHQQLTTLRAGQAKATADLEQTRADEAAQYASARSSAEGFRLQQSQLRGQQAYVLTAPQDGIVTALQTGTGRTVDATVPLMTIVPENARIHAELYAPTRAIGFVREGEEVRLLYDAFPYQRFGSFRGHIRAVSRVALDPRQIDAPFRIDEPVYRLSVVPDQQAIAGYGERVRLQPGMTLSANIVLERRTFLAWLLEPLNAVLKRDR